MMGGPKGSRLKVPPIQGACPIPGITALFSPIPPMIHRVRPPSQRPLYATAPVARTEPRMIHSDTMKLILDGGLTAEGSAIELAQFAKLYCAGKPQQPGPRAEPARQSGGSKYADALLPVLRTLKERGRPSEAKELFRGVDGLQTFEINNVWQYAAQHLKSLGQSFEVEEIVTRVGPRRPFKWTPGPKLDLVLSCLEGQHQLSV
jgi:hypothetical protein